MADLTLPGDIPNLLRRGSPVVYANPALAHVGGRGVVCDPAPDDAEFADDGLVPWLATMSGRDTFQEALGQLAPGTGASEGFGYRMDVPHVLALDLRDPTGRVHAAWWACVQPRDMLDEAEIDELVHLAFSATQTTTHDAREWWTDNQIARFRDLCAKLAEGEG